MIRRLLLIACLALVVPTIASAALTPPDPAIFDVAIENTMAGVYDGTGYVWEYKVTGVNGNNKALSHWTLGLCADWFLPGGNSPLDWSFFDFDDPDYLWNAPTTPAPYTGAVGDVYEVEWGLDPTTGVEGIKYNSRQVDGSLNSDGDFEYFSFRLTEEFKAMEANWAAKDGNVPLVYGTVLAPSCEDCPPVVPEPATLLLLGGGLLGGLAARRRKK